MRRLVVRAPFVRAVDPVCLVMADLHWIVAPCALANAKVSQAVARVAAPPQPVGDDESPGVCGTDRLHETFHNARVSFLGNIRRLVQQIETGLAVRDAFEASGQMFPMKRARVERLLVLP